MNMDFHVHGLLSKRKDFNKEFFMDVAERLGISCHNEMLGIKESGYFDCLSMYF